MLQMRQRTALAMFALVLFAARPVAAEQQAAAEGSAVAADYIILIDTSYSMLLDPTDPGRSTEELSGQLDVRTENGRFVVGRPPEGTLSAGLLRRVTLLARDLILSAADGTTVAVYAFNDRVVDSRATVIDAESRRALAEWVTTLGASGEGTAIYDSVGEALDRVDKLWRGAGESRRSTIFLFTDGDENRSKLNFDQILERFRLFKADTSHFLYWRYFTRKPDGEGAKPSPAALAQQIALRRAGVVFEDVDKVEKAFALDHVEVRPGSIDLTDEIVAGQVKRLLQFRPNQNRRGVLEVRLSAEFPDAAAKGILIRASPPRALLNVQDGETTLEVTFTAENLPPEHAWNGAAFEGVLSVTSPQLLLIEPARLPLRFSLPTRARFGKGGGALPWIILMATLGALTLWWALMNRRRVPQVLIATSDEQLCLMLLRALEGEGLALRTAHSPEQARSFVEQGRPDLLVADAGLANGALIAHARHHARHLPILLIGEDTSKNGGEAPTAVFPTPVDLERLRARVREEVA